MKKYTYLIVLVLLIFTTTSANAIRPGIVEVNKERIIYALGDIHGDLDRTIEMLQFAQIIDSNLKWRAGNSILIQTGDQIDRGTQDRETLEFFDELGVKARLHGGDVYSILGNHEINNTRMRLFDPGIGNLPFLEFFTSLDNLTPYCKKNYEKYTLDFYQNIPVPLEVQGRALAFCPGGIMAKRLSKRHIAVIIGETVFIHGGLVPKYSIWGRSGLETLNHETSLWLQNIPFTPTITGGFDGGFLQDKESPFKSRFFSKKMNDEKCKILDRVLHDLKVKRMVVGHTIQEDGITSGCNGKIHRIDTGFSRGFNDPTLGKQEILKIQGQSVEIISIKNMQ